jgi:hypothetical protein
MDTALIVAGLLLVGILIIWIFSYLSDPKQIDEEEEADVREATPQDRERSRFDEEAAKAQSNADDIAFYSPGDSSSE